MRLKDKIRFVLLGLLCIFLHTGCSTKKNTPGTRAYHELTTRYNVFFNSQQIYDETLKNRAESFTDIYSEMLPMYPFTPITDKTQPGGPFDAVIDKTTKAIREHSISSKPRRNLSQPQTQEYREWLRQNEFNPFIKNAWLLMGKAHVQNQDYEQAITVLSETTRMFTNEPDVISEAQIWMMRAYIDMNRLYDAENMAYILRARNLPKELDNLFTETYAYYLLHRKEYADALPYLQKTIARERNNRQKKRLQFLLGQTYSALGENALAFRAFEEVKGLSTPYEITLNAIVLQSAVTSGAEQRNMIKELQKMAKSAKNKEYLDKIYYASGNIYLHRNDTANAISNYLLAEKESTANHAEKTLAQITLGDIYFDRKDFVKAEPRYTDALSALPKTSAHYERVSFRSEALQELVPHLSAVEEQDSLQRLAKLPREEQLRIIQRRITELRKTERSTEREAYLAEQQARTPQLANTQPSVAESAVALAGRSDETAFYFYNSQLVSQGRNEFRRRWGNRRLEDNWRVADKQAALLPGEQVAQQSEDTEQLPQKTPTEPDAPKSTDPYSPDFYLQQLPVTPAALAESNRILEDGLYQTGNVVSARLQDFEYAIRTYQRHLADFPDSKNTPDVYYRLYLICLRIGNNALAQNYKQRLLHGFPDDEKTIIVSVPGFENNIRDYAQMQESLYQQAYQAYRDGRPKDVQQDFEEFRAKYPDSEIMPKFLLLNALSHAQTGDAETTEIHLKELVEKFPQSDATPMAQNILDGLSQGRTLAVNASMQTQWNAVAKGRSAPMDTVEFTADKNIPHLYLIAFERNALNKNAMLFATANFNFSRFQLRTFDISFVPLLDMEALIVKTFRSFGEANQYAQMIQSDKEFTSALTANVHPMIISQKNLDILLSGKTLEEYQAFYASNVDAEKWIEPIKIEAPDTIQTQKIVPLETETTPHREQQKQHVEPLPVRHDSRVTPEEKKEELERKAAEALQQQPAEPQKSREEILKERERERQQKIRQREQELRERQRQREADLRQREKEREQKVREQERIRQQKLREREKQLRERGR